MFCVICKFEYLLKIFILVYVFFIILGETFVTRKITRSVAKIFLNELDYFELGNLDSKRDWGHAKDYIEVCYC